MTSHMVKLTVRVRYIAYCIAEKSHWRRKRGWGVGVGGCIGVVAAKEINVCRPLF